MMTMTRDAKSPPVNVQVIPATSEQQPILANLLELYAYDFSEFHDVELNPDGRFGYAKLPLYWLELNRYPFLVMADRKLAGLVLVKKGSEISADDNVWDVAEFFIVRRYRRRGIGTEIAHKIWSRFPGRWEVRVMQSNPSAHHFWERTIAEFAGEPIPSVHVEKGGKPWRLFAFNSAGPDQSL
jgi:predicted acetyltransferase